jgi:hypothetical protein
LKFYEAKLLPHDEDSYMEWLTHVRHVKGAGLGTGYGAGAEVGSRQSEQEEIRVWSDTGEPDVAVKLPPSSSECQVHKQALRDLDCTMARLDKIHETRHRIIEPHIPRIFNCTTETMKMERIYPCFGLHLNFKHKLLPTRLEQDIDLWKLITMRAKKDVEGPASARWAWLKEATGTKDPIKSVAFAKGVMDATLDCVTHVRLQEEPPVVLGRGADGHIRLYRFDFGAVLLGGDYKWCSWTDFTDIHLHNYATGATMKEFPLKVDEDRLESDTDYMDGYTTTLAVNRGKPPCAFEHE